jgi:anti-sigma factor RsiW
MSTEDCRPWREQIGALALGGLWPDEQAALEAHLEGCPECREEAESLTRTAGLLALADPARAQAPAPQPSPALSDRVAREIAGERRARRRRRRRFVSGGVAVAAAAAALFVLTILPSGGSAPDSDDAEQVAFTGLPQGVGINAALESQATGTEISMKVRGMPSGTLCRVYARRADGSLVPAGSFRYVYDQGDHAASAMTTAVDLADMRSVLVRAGNQNFEQPLPS